MKAGKKELVHIQNGKPFTDSLIIAKEFEKKLDWVHGKIKAGLLSEDEEIKRFSLLHFRESDYKSRGKIFKKYNISEEGFLELGMSFTGVKARKVRIRFITAFREMLNELNRIKAEPGRKEALQYKRDAHTPMMDILGFTRETLGKATEKGHRISENLFCNRALTGEWKAIDEASLDVYDTRLLEAIRKYNTLLITRYPDRQRPERKAAMEKFVEEYRAKHPRLTLVQ